MTTSVDSPTSLVSVVIPTYGRRDYLVEAVDSVLEQTYDPIELLIVDDHSPEPVSEFLWTKSFDSLDRYNIIRHETNRGGNAARNTGIRNAQGEFVAFLDDDDYWEPEKIERQVAGFERAPADVGVVYTGLNRVNGAGTPLSTSIPSTSSPESITEKLLCGDNVVGGFSRVMVRAAAIERVGLPDERFPSWQDREWFLRLSCHYRFKGIRKPLVNYRLAGHRQIGDNFEEKRDVSYPLFLEKHRSLAAEYGESTERQFVSAMARGVAASGLKNGYYRDALKYLAISIRQYPFDLKTYPYVIVALGGPITYKLVSRLRRMVNRHGNSA